MPQLSIEKMCKEKEKRREARIREKSSNYCHHRLFPTSPLSPFLLKINHRGLVLRPIGRATRLNRVQMIEKLKRPLDQHYYKIKKEIFLMAKTLNLLAA